MLCYDIETYDKHFQNLSRKKRNGKLTCNAHGEINTSNEEEGSSWDALTTV